MIVLALSNYNMKMSCSLAFKYSISKGYGVQGALEGLNSCFALAQESTVVFMLDT